MINYIARKKDGELFKRNDDGTFSLMSSGMHEPYKYTEDRLLSDSDNFEAVTEDDFPMLEKRGKLYRKYINWTTRSDGHGGSRGGSFESFKTLYNIRDTYNLEDILND